MKPYQHNCRYKCNELVSEDDRKNVFEEFWELASWDLQNAFIVLCVTLDKPLRKRKNPVRRNKSFTKRITMLGHRVCKEFFLKTLDISDGRFNRATLRPTSTAGVSPSDKRGKTSKRNTPSIMTDAVKKHINSLPKYSSHYSRLKNPNKRYLESNLNVSKMYKMYLEYRAELSVSPVKEWQYRDIFNHDFNLSFHPPHSDTCNKCDKFQTDINALEEQKDPLCEDQLLKIKAQQELHHRRAEHAVSQKKKDKESAESTNGTTITCTFDLQKTLPTPVLTANKVYYMRVLWTYNFCVHNLVTGCGNMFVWDEGVASRGSQEVASCLKNFIESLNGVDHIIAYSDCCAGQNRNKNIAKFWMYIVKETSITVVDHKFLEPGHTYMECDQDFGVIEKSKSKMKRVYVPDDWVDVIKTASKKFKVVKMKNEDFYSVEAIDEYVNITPKSNDEDGNAVRWNSIRWMQFEKAKPFVMKTKPIIQDDMPFAVVNLARDIGAGRRNNIILKKLYANPLDIKYPKWKNLQDLKDFIPPIHHKFYDDLQYKPPMKAANKSKKGQPKARRILALPTSVTAGDESESDLPSSCLDTDEENN